MNDNESEDTINAADLDPRTTPLYKTSPERIGLAICDEFPGIWQLDFNTYADVTWYAGEPPVSVTIGYVRADLYDALQSQLAAANERADAEKTRGDWLRRQYNELHDKYAAAVKSLEDARRQVQFPRQPNGEGGWIIDANYISAIRKDCPVEWQPGEEEIEAVLLAAERAAPVPAQPAVVQDAVMRALIDAAQIAVEMIETNAHERKHVRQALKDALLAASQREGGE